MSTVGYLAIFSGVLRRIRAASTVRSACPVSDADLVAKICDPLQRYDGVDRTAKDAWTRYGSNAEGDYDFSQLTEALSLLDLRQRQLVSGFLDGHPKDARATTTVGRAAIDLMLGPNETLLSNTVFFYDVLDIQHLREDYWFYPLDIIRGIKQRISDMDDEQQNRVAAVATFTLAAAVSRGGLRIYATYDENGTLIMRDRQIEALVGERHRDISRLCKFIELHDESSGPVYVAMIEEYLDGTVPSSLRNGVL